MTELCYSYDELTKAGIGPVRDLGFTQVNINSTIKILSDVNGINRQIENFNIMDYSNGKEKALMF